VHGRAKSLTRGKKGYEAFSQWDIQPKMGEERTRKQDVSSIPGREKEEGCKVVRAYAMKFMEDSQRNHIDLRKIRQNKKG
jgi:hypothetical protein